VIYDFSSGEEAPGYFETNYRFEKEIVVHPFDLEENSCDFANS